jgi:hypothetical protein
MKFMKKNLNLFMPFMFFMVKIFWGSGLVHVKELKLRHKGYVNHNQ